MVCLDWRWFRRDDDDVAVKYTELEMTNLGGGNDDTTYQLRQCRYNRRVKPSIKQVEVGKDRIVLTDNEFIKFEYIHRFIQISPHVLVLVCFGNINPHGEFIVADNHIAVVLSFTGGMDAASRFLRDINTMILQYKRMDTYNKSVKKFIFFGY